MVDAESLAVRREPAAAPPDEDGWIWTDGDPAWPAAVTIEIADRGGEAEDGWPGHFGSARLGIP
jgi:hypothetical protein